MTKVSPFLWFDSQAEEAMEFYVSVFNNNPAAGKEGRILSKMPGPGGKMMSGTFEVDGNRFMVLNAGPRFKFNEAVSFFVDCEDQKEVDYFWNALIAGGGSESMCGWLKDKYGLSWQIIPKQLGQYLGGDDRAKASRAMQAMLKMKKIIVADLRDAYDGK